MLEEIYTQTQYFKIKVLITDLIVLQRFGSFQKQTFFNFSTKFSCKNNSQ